MKKFLKAAAVPAGCIALGMVLAGVTSGGAWVANKSNALLVSTLHRSKII
jgi:hypothetical protein